MVFLELLICHRELLPNGAKKLQPFAKPLCETSVALLSIRRLLVEIWFSILITVLVLLYGLWCFNVGRNWSIKAGAPSASPNTGSPKLPTQEECIANLRQNGEPLSQEERIAVKLTHGFICRQLRAGA